MKRIKALLVFLISSLAITGVSFFDGKIWDIIFYSVGMTAYFITGVMFSLGVLHGKQAGTDAYVYVFILLLIAGYGVYNGLKQLRLWILAWPLFVKVIVPTVIIVLLVALMIGILPKKRNDKNAQSNNQKSSE